MSSTRRLRLALVAVFATLAVLLARPARADDAERRALLRRIDYLEQLVAATMDSARHDPRVMRLVLDIHDEVSLLRAQVAAGRKARSDR